MRPIRALSEELPSREGNMARRRIEGKRKGEGQPMDPWIQRILRCVWRVGAFEKVLHVVVWDETDVGGAGLE